MNGSLAVNITVPGRLGREREERAEELAALGRRAQAGTPATLLVVARERCAARRSGSRHTPSKPSGDAPAERGPRSSARSRSTCHRARVTAT
jgi:hypothetical protein